LEKTTKTENLSREKYFPTQRRNWQGGISPSLALKEIQILIQIAVTFVFFVFIYIYIYIYTLKNIKLIFFKKIILIYFQAFLKNILHYTILN
jgi:hypothetical protein